MDTEFEAKFYPVDKDKYREKLKSIGAKLLYPERKMKRVIASHVANPIYPENHYLRIRDEGNGIIRMSIKITAEKTGKMSDQKETDVEVGDFEKTKEILESTGIKFNRYQETLREEWEFEGADITIDTWPGLETYSEIEADSEEHVEKIAKLLGLPWEEKLIMSAGDLYRKVYGLSHDEVSEKITDLTFENNTFEGLKKIWPPKK